jgi:hypothetical protein
MDGLSPFPPPLPPPLLPPLLCLLTPSLPEIKREARKLEEEEQLLKKSNLNLQVLPLALSNNI